MPVTMQTYGNYERIALEHPEGQWELHRGQLREKPAMTASHNRVGWRLGFQLGQQLDPNEFDVRVNAGRVRRIDETVYIPDVLVIPVALVGPLLERSDVLEAYQDPLPFVAEVWPPSTGVYDVDTKLPEYQRRGDHEIWRLHPYDRSLRAWRLQADGSYLESVYYGGIVEIAALPRVAIDLDALFA